MVLLIALLAMFILPVQRFARATFERGLRVRLLLVREAFASLAAILVVVWQGWCSYEPAPQGVGLGVTFGLLVVAYVGGEAVVRTLMRRAGVSPAEGPRGPLY